MKTGLVDLIEPEDGDLRKNLCGTSYADERFRRGDTCDVVADIESNQLHPQLTTPTINGLVIVNPFLGDLGEVVHIHERTIALPDDVVYGAIPALVVGRNPETFHQGTPLHVAASEYYELFFGAPGVLAKSLADLPERIKAHNKLRPENERIPLPPKESIHYFRRQRPTGQDRKKKNKKRELTGEYKDVVYLPTLDDREGSDTYGQVVYRHALSGNGRFAFYQGDDGFWHRVDAKKTNAYYNLNADRNWIMSLLHRFQFPEKYITHCKRNYGYELDILPTAREYAILGDQGENGIKPGEYHHPELGRVKTFSKGPFVEANTRHENPRLGIAPGVRLPDKSHYDEGSDHVSPAYDCLVEWAELRHMEKNQPELMRLKRKMSDPDKRHGLLLGRRENGQPKVFSFVRNCLPFYIGGHMVTYLGSDRAYGEFKRTVGVVLDKLHRDPDAHDPEALLLPDGRNIFELKEDDWLALMRRYEHERSADAALEITRDNRSPSVQSFETGLRAGANHGVSANELMRRADEIHKHPELRTAVMNAYARFISSTSIPENAPDPHPDLFVHEDTGNPLFQCVNRPNRQEGEEMARTLRNRAQDVLDYYRMRNDLVRKLIRPRHQLEGTQQDPDYHKEYAKDIQKVGRDLARRALKARKLGIGPHIRKLPIPEKIKFKNNAEALEFLHKIRFKALTEEWLKDMDGATPKLVDRKTRRQVDYAELETIDKREFNKRTGPRGRWTFWFEELEFSTDHLARLIFLSGQGQRLIKTSPEWNIWDKGRRSYGKHGPPNIDPDLQPGTTHEKELRIVERIMGGSLRPDALIRECGMDPDEAHCLYARFVAGRSGMMPALAKLKKYNRDGLEEDQWEPETMRPFGFDPDTKEKYPHIVYPLSRAAFEDPAQTCVIEAPEYIPDNPAYDPAESGAIYMIPCTERINKAWQSGALTQAANMVFRTGKTGRHFFAPHCEFEMKALKDLPDRQKNHFKNLQCRSGVTQEKFFDEIPQLYVVCERPTPLAATMPVPPAFDVQTPTERFLALKAPELTGYKKTPDGELKKLTGLIVQDRFYTPGRGFALNPGDAIRFREFEKQGNHETGWELSSRLTSVSAMTFAEFDAEYQKGNDGKITEQFARDHGYPDRTTAYSELAALFTRVQRPLQSEMNRLLILKFEEVTGDAVFFDPRIVPRAAVRDNYQQSIRNQIQVWGAYPVSEID